MGTPQPAAPDPALDALLAALPGLGHSELMMLGAVPAPSHASRLETARGMARRAATRTRRDSAVARLRAAIVTWSGANGAASGVYAPVSPPGDLLLADLRSRAVPAILDATSAIVLSDVLDRETRRVLMATWLDVHGPDAPDPDAGA